MLTLNINARWSPPPPNSPPFMHDTRTRVHFKDISSELMNRSLFSSSRHPFFPQLIASRGPSFRHHDPNTYHLLVCSRPFFFSGATIAYRPARSHADQMVIGSMLLGDGSEIKIDPSVACHDQTSSCFRKRLAAGNDIAPNVTSTV